MTYTVRLRDGSVYSLSEENGFDLKGLLLEAKKPFYAELGNDSVLSSQIVKISKDRLTEADIPNFQQVALVDRTCHSQHSIQHEISLIAKRSGKDWIKLIASPTWREEVRQRLQASGKQWCDDKAGTCACDPL